MVDIWDIQVYFSVEKKKIVCRIKNRFCEFEDGKHFMWCFPIGCCWSRSQTCCLCWALVGDTVLPKACCMKEYISDQTLLFYYFFLFIHTQKRSLTSFVCFGQILPWPEKPLRAKLIGCFQLQNSFSEVFHLKNQTKPWHQPLLGYGCAAGCLLIYNNIVCFA